MLRKSRVIIFVQTRTAYAHRAIQFMAPKWIWVDTDAGVDDAVALCAALKLQKEWGYVVKGISTSFGNTTAENVNINVRKVMKSCVEDLGGIGCGIFAGAERGLRGETADASYFHGKDGLGDAEIENPVDVLLEGKGAVDGIVAAAEDALREGAKLSVVTIGPCTNFALAMKEEGRGEWTKGVDRLVVMGGCGNAHGNATRVAEFNVKADVTAAAYVFENWRRPLTVVSWDLCCVNPIPWSDFHSAVNKDKVCANVAGAKRQQHIGFAYLTDKSFHDSLRSSPSQHDSSVGRFLKIICRDIYSNEKDAEKRSGEGAVMCDFLAVACAVDEDVVVEGAMVNVEVETAECMTNGMTLVDWGCYDGVEEREKRVKWVKEVDMQRVVKMLEKTVE